jgi:hypothetical protein
VSVIQGQNQYNVSQRFHRLEGEASCSSVLAAEVPCSNHQLTWILNPICTLTITGEFRVHGNTWLNSSTIIKSLERVCVCVCVCAKRKGTGGDGVCACEDEDPQKRRLQMDSKTIALFPRTTLGQNHTSFKEHIV